MQWCLFLFRNIFLLVDVAIIVPNASRTTQAACSSGTIDLLWQLYTAALLEFLPAFHNRQERIDLKGKRAKPFHFAMNIFPDVVEISSPRQGK
jgi:hypothetical protein